MVNGIPFSAQPKRALVVVTDGLGFDPDKVRDLARRTIDELNPHTRRMLLDASTEVANQNYTPLDLARLTVMPITAEGISPDLTWREAIDISEKVRNIREKLRHQRLLAETASIRRRIAFEHRYIPWIAEIPEWSEFVNAKLTVPTNASGVWVGYEDVDPPVQGNSETGHQQIGNLALAPQIPLQISRSIEDSSFFKIPILRKTIEEALNDGRNINFCFLLSGIRGSDGRVHSAWNHLEAFCNLIFSRVGAPPHRVRMQAVLDGRDAPAHGSIQLEGVDGGYLGELQRLLNRYNAIESLAWVIGRSLSMDRDYREENAQCDYLLMTQAKGQIAHSFDDIASIVKSTHDTGFTDADVPAIALHHNCKPPSVIEPGDVFINLNFRSDRQRSKTASLCGARDYLDREAKSRGRIWNFDWLRTDLHLRICTIAEYDAEFETRYGVNVLYPITPHQLNLLSNWDRFFDADQRYLLVAESVKASHMGYFVRGRREAEQGSKSEDRWIVPSDGADEGVMSDSDFYLRPAMKTREIAQLVAEAMSDANHRLIICNLAATDMIGHLLPTRFDAAVEAYRTTVETLAELTAIANANGYSVVVTSDHGNIENDAPTHTSNPVLTTIVPIQGTASPLDLDAPYSANLYDVSHTSAQLIGISSNQINEVVKEFRGRFDERFIGKTIARLGYK